MSTNIEIKYKNIMREIRKCKAFHKQQLFKKDYKISQLKKELEKKNAEIMKYKIFKKKYEISQLKRELNKLFDKNKQNYDNKFSESEFSDYGDDIYNKALSNS